jgi:hypothetical protein
MTVDRSDPLVVRINVEYRPATYATAGEMPWRAAVAAALDKSGVTPQHDAWFAVSIDFRTPAPLKVGES